MTEGLDVQPQALHEIARLLRWRRSTLSSQASLDVHPDAGASSGEVALLLGRLEEVARALGDRVSSLGDGVEACAERYARSDRGVHERLRRLTWGGEP